MKFPEIKKIGFYPVLNSADLVERLLKVGVKTMQIRIKGKVGEDYENEIKKATEIVSNYQDSQFLINDDWRLAIKYKAFGVHLGQEDINTLSYDNFQEICDAGLRLGISTHNEEEVQKALKFNPSYISIGPIFHTNSKNMPYEIQGIEGFRRWRKLLKNISLVAIAGIKIENCKDLIEAGADGIAVMSDITENTNPEKRAMEWLKIFEDICYR